MPQFVITVSNPITGLGVRKWIEPHRLRQFWAQEVSLRRKRGLLVGEDRRFLASAFALREIDSRIAIPVPGGGLLEFMREAPCEYEFSATVPWAPIATMGLLTTVLFRHDFEVEVLSDAGFIPASIALAQMINRRRREPLRIQYSNWAAPPIPVVEVRFALEQQRVFRVSVGVLGSHCGSVRFRAGPSAHELPEFFHYQLRIDAREEWLYHSRDDYRAGKGTPLHDDSIVRDIDAHCREDSSPFDSPSEEIH